MGVWLDRIIVSAIVVVGLIIMYKALKEPLDLLFAGIKKLFVGIKDKVSDSDLTGGYETITYG